MFGKEEEPLTFRKVVSNRYKTDTVMGIFCTILLFILPLVSLSAIILSGEVEPYENESVMASFVLYFPLASAVFYLLYNRLETHSKRDRDWRRMLIDFEDRVGADSTELRKLDKKISRNEKFVCKWFIKLIMVAIVIAAFICIIINIPQDSEDSLSNTMALMVACISLFFLQLFLSFYAVITFPNRHEASQNDFTVQFSYDVSKVGIKVPPMIKVVSHHGIFLHIFLLLLTGGLWSIYLMSKAYRSLNMHLMNQWVYETELLKVIESNGRKKFENYLPDYSCDSRMSRKEQKRLNRTNLAHVANKVTRSNRMPRIMYLAEIFLFFILFNYQFKIVTYMCEICNDLSNFELSLSDISTFFDLTGGRFYILFMIGLNLFFFVTTVMSVLSIGSRKPASWRKVVRSCATFFVSLLFARLVPKSFEFAHVLDLDIAVMFVLMLALIVIMVFARSVREFYAPVGDEMPDTKEWIVYAFHGTLGGKELEYDIGLEDSDMF